MDEAGNVADSVTRTVEVTNRHPGSINLSHNRVEENLPAGTLVGFLSATDPDANQPIGLEMITQAESGMVPPFSLDEDGGLRTTRTLDFEQMSFYSLSVHAFDPYGGMMEKNFIIEVVDAFLPIVDTFSVQAQITPFLSLIHI